MAIVARYLTESEFYSGLGGQDAVFSIENNEDTLNLAIERSEQEVDGYLLIRYVLPTSPQLAPPHLKTLVLGLLKYHVKNIAINQSIEEEDRRAYNASINFLSSVREGKKSSSSIIGLVERNKAGELRVAVSELDPIRQPVQSGRLDGLHPIHDRLISNRSSSLSQDELDWLLPWAWK